MSSRSIGLLTSPTMWKSFALVLLCHIFMTSIGVIALDAPRKMLPSLLPRYFQLASHQRAIKRASTTSSRPDPVLLLMATVFAPTLAP
jgi:hypothetical protein